MTISYHCEFSELENISLPDDGIEEISEQIIYAVLQFDSRNVKYKLTLENPKIPAMPSTTIRDLFKTLTLDSIDSFKVFGKQYNADVQWHIEIWMDGGPLINHTIHCRNIQGLP